MLAGEYRRLHQQRLHPARWRRHLRRAWTTATATASSGKEFRGYFQGFGGYGVSDHSQAGFDVFLTSDNTFLDRYQIGDSERPAQPGLSGGLRSNRNFWSLNGYYFQGLRPFDDQDTIPVALPLAETRLVSDRYALGLLLHRRLRTSWR